MTKKSIQKRSVKGKNIIICSDGTGNSAAKANKTNVFRIFESASLGGFFDKENKAGVKQVAFYDDGVGTDNVKFLKAIGGAFGWGVSNNVRQLYEAVARVYKPGDSIYLFGFSRGAYTVRALAGFISQCGIIDNNKDNVDLTSDTKEAYRVYRKTFHTALAWIGHLIRRTPDPETFRNLKAVRMEDGGTVPEIEFIGVWDTVSAIGFPLRSIRWIINTYIYKFEFSDRKLGKNIKRAYHALSIDDERKTFHPNLWDESEKEKNNQIIEQVWFPGVHSNVGGGYPKQGISYVCLNWIMDKAERKPGSSKKGIEFTENARNYVKSLRNASDKMYNSRSGLSVFYRYLPRDISTLCAKASITPKIHYSVFERIVQCPEDYKPINLPANLTVVKDDETIKTDRIEKQWEEIAKSLNGKTSFLGILKPWIKMREAAHFLLLTTTFLIFIIATTEHGMKLKDFNTEFATIIKIWKLILLDPWLFALIIPIFVLAFIGRYGMYRKTCIFWNNDNRNSFNDFFEL